MNIERPEITPQDLINAVSQLGELMNTNIVIWAGKFDTLLKTLDKHLPGFKNDYQKEMFRQQCYKYFLAIERARRGANPDALK